MNGEHAQSDVRGFTLIEVMIAIVIMAVLSLMAWRGLDSMSRTNARLEERSAQSAQLMRALQQIERDVAWRSTVELPSVALDQASPDPAAPAATGVPGTATAAAGMAAGRGAAPPPQMPTLVALLPPGMTATRPTSIPLRFELVRAAPAAPGQWQRVQWWMQDGTLFRAAGSPSASYPLPVPRPEARVAVLADITAFDVRAWEPEKGWQPLPATNPVRASASGLEITLAMRRGAGPVLRYRQAIALQ